MKQKEEQEIIKLKDLIDKRESIYFEKKKQLILSKLHYLQVKAPKLNEEVGHNLHT